MGSGLWESGSLGTEARVAHSLVHVGQAQDAGQMGPVFKKSWKSGFQLYATNLNMQITQKKKKKIWRLAGYQFVSSVLGLIMGLEFRVGWIRKEVKPDLGRTSCPCICVCACVCACTRVPRRKVTMAGTKRLSYCTLP